MKRLVVLLFVMLQFGLVLRANEKSAAAKDIDKCIKAHVLNITYCKSF